MRGKAAYQEDDNEEEQTETKEGRKEGRRKRRKGRMKELNYQVAASCSENFAPKYILFVTLGITSQQIEQSKSCSFSNRSSLAASRFDCTTCKSFVHK